MQSRPLNNCTPLFSIFLIGVSSINYCHNDYYNHLYSKLQQNTVDYYTPNCVFIKL